MSRSLGSTSTGSLNPKMNAGEEERTGQGADLPGLLGRYFSVFTSPDKLFRALRTRPEWMGAMLLGSCLMLAGTVLIPPELTMATLRERMLETGRAIPPGFEDQMALFRYAGAAAAFVFWSIMLAVFAGVVTVFFALLLGHEGTYRQYLAVVAHALLIPATATVLLVPLKIAAEDAQLLLSVGAFATFLEAGYLLRFLSFLDLFGLWAWVLVGLGAARIGRKESWAGGAISLLAIPVMMAAVIAIFTG